MRTGFSEALQSLHPANFAMTMATGIVSIAAQMLGMTMLAVGLFYLNILLYVILCALTICRLIFHRKVFLSDLLDHNKGVGFFTLVAGTCVLGSQFAVIVHDYSIAMQFLIGGSILWALFIYTIYTGFTIKETKPPLEGGINGGWLLAVVATQSVSVLSGRVLPCVTENVEMLLFYSLTMWLCGGMLYIWLIALIFYRYTFFKFLPSDFAPPYWINMGAVSITTLGGTTLIANAPESQLLTGLLPFLKGFTLFFWATGTWWIPMLFILGVWRHFFKRYPFKYDPLYWGLVFPLGMYTTCTFQLAGVTGLDFLYFIPRYFVYVALAAWVLVFCGLLSSLSTKFFSNSRLVLSPDHPPG